MNGQPRNLTYEGRSKLTALLLSHKTYPQIGREMHVPVNTVTHWVRKLLQEYGALDRYELELKLKEEQWQSQ